MVLRKRQKSWPQALEVGYSLAAERKAGTSGWEVSSEARACPKQLPALALGPEFKGSSGVAGVTQ